MPYVQCTVQTLVLNTKQLFFGHFYDIQCCSIKVLQKHLQILYLPLSSNIKII